MSSEQVRYIGTRGFPILTILVIVLGILKIAGVSPFVTWSWWIIALPWWGPIALVLGIALLAGHSLLVVKLLTRD